MLLLCSIVVSAQENTINIDESNFGWWDNFLYKLSKVGLFTAAGQERQCSPRADLTIDPTMANSYNLITLRNQACGSGSALFDVFRSDWSYVGEYRFEDYEIVVGIPVGGKIEAYCCPYPACESDADCLNSGEGTKCNLGYGSCYDSVPSHETKLYRCYDGVWQQLGYASFGDDRFCSDDDDNNYLDMNGGEHCRESTYSSVRDGTWCHVDSCTPDWQIGSWGTCVNEKQTRTVIDSKNCGVNTGKPDDERSCSGGNGGDEIDDPQLKDDVEISNLIIKDFYGDVISEVYPGQSVKVSFKVSYDKLFPRSKLIESGVIPKSTSKDWGLSSYGFFSIFSTVGDESEDACCSGMENIKDNFFPITAVGAKTYEYSMKVPDSSTKDLCGSEVYWDDSEDYVVYAIVKNGCTKEGYVHAVYKTINIKLVDEENYTGGDGNGDGNGDNGEDAEKRNSIPAEDISSTSIGYLKEGICFGPEDCPSDTKCKNMEILLNNNLLLDSQAKALRDEFCGLYSPLTMLENVFNPDIGLTTYKESCVSITGKQDYFNSKFGVCVSGEEEGINLAKYFSWAAIFSITGDDGVDGLIISIGGFVLIMFLFSMGGRRR